MSRLAGVADEPVEVVSPCVVDDVRARFRARLAERTPAAVNPWGDGYAVAWHAVVFAGRPTAYVAVDSAGDGTRLSGTIRSSRVVRALYPVALVLLPPAFLVLAVTNAAYGMDGRWPAWFQVAYDVFLAGIVPWSAWANRRGRKALRAWLAELVTPDR